MEPSKERRWQTKEGEGGDMFSKEGEGGGDDRISDPEQ